VIAELDLSLPPSTSLWIHHFTTAGAETDQSTLPSSDNGSGGEGRAGHRSCRVLALSPVSTLRPAPFCSADSACCCWCVPPRPGLCGASSTPSCGTGESIGMSRVPSGESQLRLGCQPGSSRGNMVSASPQQGESE
jgi:hypothetical protein